MTDLYAELAAYHHGVDPDLFAALVNAESGGVRNPSQAISNKGAMGPGQLMPDTARAMGVRDIHDPLDNLMGSAKYLSQQLRDFGGDPQLALAAYNAGPGAVRKFGGVPPYKETQGYVAKILGALNPVKSAQAEEAPQDDDLYAAYGITPKAEEQKTITRPPGGLREGFMRALDKQAIGVQQLGSDLARFLGGDIGKPKSAYRNKLDKEGERLLAESDKSNLLEKSGEGLMNMLEFAALPSPAKLGSNLLTNFGIGALYGAIQPNADAQDRAMTIIRGGVGNAGLSAAGSGLGALLGMAGKTGRGIVNKNYGAAREIERKYGAGFGSDIPRLPPNGGGASLPPESGGPGRPPYALVPGVKPTAGMLADDPRILELEMNARNRSSADFLARDLENKAAVYRALEGRAIPDDKANVLQDALNARTSELRNQAMDAARNQGQQELSSQALKKRKAPINRAIDHEKDDIIKAIRKLGGINKESADSILGGKPWENTINRPDPNFGPVWRKNGGQSIDNMARRLYEEGYLSGADPREIADILYHHGQGSLDASAMFSNKKSDSGMYQPQSAHDKLMRGLERLIGTLESRNAPKIKDVTAATPTPGYAQPLAETIKKMQTMPGSRGVPSTQTLANLGDRILSQKNVQPEDLYALRKLLDDKLNAKGVAFDELTNAAKSSRREAVEMKKAVDKGLNDYSEGAWGKYLSEYKKGMGPIAEGRAFQNILDKFETRAPIPGTDIPEITPAGLRQVVDAKTWKSLGKSGLADLLSPTGRQAANDAVRVMNDIEKARKGSVAVTGSPTASFISSLMKSGLVPGGGKLAAFINIADALGRSRGAMALDDALLNPEKLNAILALYSKTGTPKSEVLRIIERSLRSTPANISTGRYD